MKKLFLHLILSFFLIKVALISPSSPSRKKALTSIQAPSILKAYLLGDKSSLPYKLKKAHKKLHLNHLMTPSGLHLSSALFLILVFVKRRSFRFFLFFSIGLFFYSLNLFPAMNRMAWFGAIKQTNSKGPLFNFYLTFLMDFILGSWFKSPLSFSLSFLFLGIILHAYQLGKKQTFLSLGIGQILVSFLFQSAFYPIGFSLGFVITSLIPFLFPLFLLSFIVDINMVGWFENLILFLSQFSFIKVKISLIALLFIPLIYKPKVLLILLSLYIGDLHNFPKHLQSRRAFIAPAPKNPTQIIHKSWGSLSTYENQMRCFNRLYPDGWSTRCHL